MKLEPLFTSKENTLFALDGSAVSTDKCVALQAKGLSESFPVPADNGNPLLVRILWSQIGLDEGSYNEELLASLRDFLKVLDGQNRFVFIVPDAEKPSLSEGEREAFTASCKHCARRIKDCRSVIGFALPEQVDSSAFMEELSQKHSHYIYFSRSESELSNPCIVRF